VLKDRSTESVEAASDNQSAAASKTVMVDPVVAATALPTVPASTSVDLATETIPGPVVKNAETPSTDFVLSGGIESSQSWLGANKYVLVVLLLVAGTVAAFLWRFSGR
jgi:hypothetical protein